MMALLVFLHLQWQHSAGEMNKNDKYFYFQFVFAINSNDLHQQNLNAFKLWFLGRFLLLKKIEKSYSKTMAIHF